MGQALRDAMTPPAQPAPSQAERSSPVEELTKLKALLDSGAISQEEFDRLKREIMARIGS